MPWHLVPLALHSLTWDLHHKPRALGAVASSMDTVKRTCRCHVRSWLCNVGHPRRRQHRVQPWPIAWTSVEGGWAVMVVVVGGVGWGGGSVKNGRVRCVILILPANCSDYVH